ncbi:DUF4846 domain-containing protein [Pontibacter sp. HSC-14F20]|uniref:DUF4846 domain-containing protein n=1 Tax=Pontibacter sp. HSC-14F20 TaxID=2864136 RepID=UPI001C72FAB5|nr:DUF4846 domain-containing protein [Pontibacter sp. HSC-14F20]MBX0333290.1 DUF4846 domain-containing protein [Pontibacter sp. HSC-14F20]
MSQYLYSILFILLTACGSKAEQVTAEIPEGITETKVLVNPAGKTVSERFSPPRGYKRAVQSENTFGAYLQHFKLKPHGAQVHYYNGAIKPNDNIYDAVLDIDVGKRDLQQCADAVMRLRAEYLYGQEKYDAIHFNFTSGFRADYSKWQQGYRVQVKGNDCSWVKKAAPSTAYAFFKDYLQVVFTYAGTLSLEKEMKAVSMADLQAGDVFIKGGSPGHAVIVMDVAVDAQTGEKLFLLAQSYMPAQEIQILKNPMDPGVSPWYSSNFSGPLLTPEWTFQRSHLKRF